ncbi:hypothetical protein SUDANB6_05873 [Streptomyces sp. enrichment culture]
MIHTRIAQAVVAFALGVGTLLPSAAMTTEPAVLAADTLRPGTGTWGG